MSACTHLDTIKIRTSVQYECAACAVIGAQAEHLVLCTTCGNVACGDGSKFNHARMHFRATGHPVVLAFRSPEKDFWCFVDEVRFASA